MKERTDPKAISQAMKSHYEWVWQSGDAWKFETSDYERQRYDALVAMLASRRYAAALEIGCGSGQLTKHLAGLSDRLLAIDISSAAIDRARTQLAASTAGGSIELRVADIVTDDHAADGPWDLIVFSETIYSIGWLYPMFDVAVMADRLRAGLRPGGRLLLSNTYGAAKDWLLRPWLIDTYRDLFRNVGLTLEREEVFTGIKDTVEMRVLMSLFTAR